MSSPKEVIDENLADLAAIDAKSRTDAWKLIRDAMVDTGPNALTMNKFTIFLIQINEKIEKLKRKAGDQEQVNKDIQEYRIFLLDAIRGRVASSTVTPGPNNTVTQEDINRIYEFDKTYGNVLAIQKGFVTPDSTSAARLSTINAEATSMSDNVSPGSASATPQYTAQAEARASANTQSLSTTTGITNNQWETTKKLLLSRGFKEKGPDTPDILENNQTSIQMKKEGDNSKLVAKSTKKPPTPKDLEQTAKDFALSLQGITPPPPIKLDNVSGEQVLAIAKGLGKDLAAQIQLDESILQKMRASSDANQQDFVRGFTEEVKPDVESKSARFKNS